MRQHSTAVLLAKLRKVNLETTFLRQNLGRVTGLARRVLLSAPEEKLFADIGIGRRFALCNFWYDKSIK
jgi:hypothetical protein